MKRTWKPTVFGILLTSATARWQIVLDNDTLRLVVGSRSFQASIQQEDTLIIKPGVFWSTVTFISNDGIPVRVDGIPNRRAKDMYRALLGAKANYESKVARLKSIQIQIKEVYGWYLAVAEMVRIHKAKRRWISEEALKATLDSKPAANELFSFQQEPEVLAHIKQQEEAVQKAMRLWLADLREIVANLNKSHLDAELIACRDFFNRVEKSPLTDEQARAVVCFDNRVQVVASAGSGKTSTMVAKAGYALHRKLIPPDRILLLTFNADAAKELQARIQERLAPLDFPADQVVARTFHAFGLDVIGQATGKKPSLAPWLDHGKDLEVLSDIVDDLKNHDESFRTKWDLFRVVFSRDLPKFGIPEEPEDWDNFTKKTGYRTLRGEVVKSQEEKLIADWLFYNGVDYRYEQAYEVDTADPTHRQYQPDFYYPAANAYHEHFALDSRGRPPEQYNNYLDGVKWKRRIHAEMGTTLWETTSATVRSGKAFKTLAKNFKKAEVVLDPNPDRPVHGRKPMEHKDLVKIFRVFLTHVKSNGLSDYDLRTRLKKQSGESFNHRHEMFLQLFEVIRDEWERRLREEKVIDFEDMLNLAAEHVESGRWVPPFELVMVDEFQDASWARARLTQALVRQPGRFLFAVGDDWQSINRFAGADISVMTSFETWFGKAQTLRLERTFRCPQSLCTISSCFVLKNPAQITKSVYSSQTEYPPTIQVFQVQDENHIRSAMETYLAQLHEGVANGSVPAGKEKHGIVEVFVLGRYRKDNEFVLPQWERRFGDRLSVKFMTIHGSKGLEADYVILPRLIKGAYGFPSTIEDDPILQLAMPQGETYTHAEERRLFYVALTRAKRSVVLITVEHRVSDFIVELMKDHHIEVWDIDGGLAKTVICPKCQQGTLVQRTRRSDGSKFWGCNRFPKCGYTLNAIAGAEA
jgi:DNA helicase-4